MAYHIERRKTLFVPHTGPTHDRERGHLFVVLTGRCDAGNHLLIPVCSAYDKCDTTCLLQVGDHDFLDRESFAFYAKMRIHHGDNTNAKIEAGAIQERGYLAEPIFEGICAGVEASPFSPPIFKKYYRANASARMEIGFDDPEEGSSVA